MKKEYIVGSIMLVLFASFILVLLPNNNKPDKVYESLFVDDEMKNTIINTSLHYKIIKTEDEFTLECLEEIGWLNIGYTGYYNTLDDIKLCKNLHTLYIGFPQTDSGNTYVKKWCVSPKPESKEKILQIEEELGEILQECTQLRSLYIRNEEGTCELENLDFLVYGEKLTALWLRNQKELEYSRIYDNCPNVFILMLTNSEISDLEGIRKMEKLETLDIRYTNVYEAGDIVNLTNLKYLDICGTPLAENEEELNIIREALPDIKIDIDND